MSEHLSEPCKHARFRAAATAGLGLVLLVAVVAWRGDAQVDAGPAAANAAGIGGQPGAQVPPGFNAADQRERLIDQMQEMNKRLARIEAKLDRGVKITEMPKIVVDKD